MSSEPAIIVEKLHKTFPVYGRPHHRLLELFDPRADASLRWREEFHALKGLDLEVGRGQTVGIVGRNGSGKSTLLQIICGTLAPTSGKVAVNGRIAALLELGAGFNPEFSGRENVYLNGTILGLERAEIDRRLDAILAFADIGAFIDQPVKTYSSGMYVRLAFAVAINVDPEILIVDEALSVGDEAFQRKCFGRIEQIREAGATVLFVSHSAGTVVDLCDQAVLLDRGELLAQGMPKRIVTQYQKLIYASPERQHAIREAIRAGSEEASPVVQPMRAGAVGGANMDSTSIATSDAQRAWFDPGLQTADAVAYENRGAEIVDPHLRTLDGERVNVLVHGEEYDFVYGVKVERTLARMRCGLMIRTTTGIEVSGHVTDGDAGHMALVPAGAHVDVRLRFRCLFTAGTYFLNAGCVARIDEQEQYIDRRVDVAMFRVQPYADARATALVDLVEEEAISWQM